MGEDEILGRIQGPVLTHCPIANGSIRAQAQQFGRPELAGLPEPCILSPVTKMIRSLLLPRRAFLCASLVLLLPLALPAQSVTRGPYLQLQTPVSAVVAWRTDVPTDSRVLYGTAVSALTSSASDPTPTTEHRLTLSGLATETRYYYSVGTSSVPLAGADASHYFSTAPPAGAARPVRMWVTGDSGTADARPRAVRDSYLAFAAGRATDVWLMLGDNAYVNGTDSEYQAAVFDVFPGILRNTFLWPTLGNHDGYSANSATQTGPYFDIFTLPAAGQAGGLASGTEAYYSFNYANIHFVCLDSYGSPRGPADPMLTCLAADLAVNTRDWTIAYWHHPPYSKGSHDSDVEGELVEMRQQALPVLEAGGVDLVLAGHSHAYERSFLLDGHYGASTTLVPSMKKDGGSGRETGTGAYRKRAGVRPREGTVYVVAGTSGQIGGGTLNHPAMFYSLAELGSLVLDVEGDRLDARFLTSTGAIADSFTILRSTQFHTVTPCRLLDTRLPDGPGGGPAVTAGSDRTVAVTGRCGVPASARTLSVNIAVTRPTNAGYLVATAAAARPAPTSTINFRAGQTRSNGARVPLGPGGALLLRSSDPGTVDVVIDVDGYFE